VENKCVAELIMSLGLLSYYGRFKLIYTAVSLQKRTL